jgi:hypothetical protein
VIFARQRARALLGITSDLFAGVPAGERECVDKNKKALTENLFFLGVTGGLLESIWA